MSSAVDTMESRSVTTGAGKSKASLRFQTDSSPPHHAEGDEFEHSSPIVIQRLPPVRQTYSYPGSVANPSTFDKFRFLTEESMTRALHEAKKTMEEERYRRICGKKKMRGAAADDMGGDNNLCADISRSCYEKWVKQIKWFWFEIEDYLREIETVYNEVRLHADSFLIRKKDKEEDARRQRRVNEFTSRSCRIVYDLQQQIRDVFSALDSNSNILSKVVMKKIHSIHRGAVIALQNLLTRLPDFELDRGLPPAYHQLAMLIRRLAQICYQLKFGQEVNIIRTLEGIRQKVESATSASPELPLYRMTPPAKRPLTTAADVWTGPSKPTKTCPVVWQEFDSHSKGKRPPKDVPSKIMDMIDVSSHQGYIAPVQLQQGIDRFLRIKSPIKEGKGRPGAATSKLMAALKGQTGARDDEFDSISRRLKALQQEFITEVEGEISARLKPLLQEAKKVANTHGKRGKTVNISHVQVEHPRDPLARQKSKVRNVLGFLNKVDSELQVKDPKRMMGEGFDLSDMMTEKLLMGSNKPRRARSPVTMRQPRAARASAALQQASNERLSRPKTASLKTNPLRTTITRRTSSAQAPSNKPMLMTPGGDASVDMWKTLKGASRMAKLAVTKMPMKSLLSEKEQMVYQLQEKANETNVEDEEGHVTRGKRVAAGGGGTGAGSMGQDDLQWALQGSLSLWNPNQVDEMLGKLKDMEDDEHTIRQRWQDLLYLDPALTGASSNYRIAYGESKEFADNKEPDAIVLMKPSKKDDTLVVVTSLPSRGGGSEDASTEAVKDAGEGEEGDRARAGKDPFAFNGTRLYHSISYLNAVEKYCQNFDVYLRRTSHYSVGDFDPWRVVEDVADDILVDLFGDVAVEIVDIPEACVKEMYEAEFAQA